MKIDENTIRTTDILLKLDNPGHVYIQGEPGLGKTELVDFYLTGRKYWKAGESSGFLFGTLPEDTEYVWFEDFDMNKYHSNLNNMLSLMAIYLRVQWGTLFFNN
jgi:hypothetical protein